MKFSTILAPFFAVAGLAAVVPANVERANVEREIQVDNSVLYLQALTISIKTLEQRFRQWPGTLETMAPLIRASTDVSNQIRAAWANVRDNVVFPIPEDATFQAANEIYYVVSATDSTLDVVDGYKPRFDALGVSTTIGRKVNEGRAQIIGFFGQLVPLFGDEYQATIQALVVPVDAKFATVLSKYGITTPPTPAPLT